MGRRVRKEVKSVIMQVGNLELKFELEMTGKRMSLEIVKWWQTGENIGKEIKRKLKMVK